MSDFQIKISPRVFNIFYPNLFYSETMNLLHRFRAFPALSEVFGKTRNYTYQISETMSNFFCESGVGGNA